MFEIQMDGGILRAVLAAFSRHKSRLDLPAEAKEWRNLRVVITQFKGARREDLVDVRFSSEPLIGETAPLLGSRTTRSYLVRTSDGAILEDRHGRLSLF